MTPTHLRTLYLSLVFEPRQKQCTIEMLRPAKILLSSLHQLRHYFEGKVAELVQQPPPFVSQALQTARTKFYHTATHQHNVVANHPNAPTLFHVAEREHQRLLRALQQQFPIVKVFSSPRPGYAHHFSFASNVSSRQQFRTIVSSGATASPATAGVLGQADGFYVAAGGFCGYPRTAMIGYARTPFAVRQFSTAKSPCVTLFQQQSSGQAAANNIFSHASSRFFSPAGSKMNSPPAQHSSDAHCHSAPLQPKQAQDDDDDDENANAFRAYNRIFARCADPGKGMYELLIQDDKQQQQQQPGRRRAGLVRRASVACKKANINLRTRPVRQPYDYIRHDDLSCMYTPESQRKHMIRHWHSSRLKAPPPPNKEQEEEGPPVVYLAFRLDNLWRISSFARDSRRHLLDPSFIGSLAEGYQMHLTEIVTLLSQLQQHGRFQVAVCDDELRVIFPSTVFWSPDGRKEYARRWLARIGIDPDNPYFTLHESRRTESQEQEEETTEDEEQSSSSSSSSQQDHLLTSEIFGPEYFRGIQAFLDHVDELIESGPAFARCRV